MSWDARQTAMLEAMGLRVWSEPAHVTAATATVTASPIATAPSTTGIPPVPPTDEQPARIAARPVSQPNVMPAPLTADWPALEAAVASCQACALAQGRTQTVFGSGHLQAHWLVVGEAPGETEDGSGQPFAGDSGVLLDNMLRALGLGRQDGPPETQVFLSHALKCRPPRQRNPDAAELAACAPYLQRQIALLQPRIILALGAFAVQALLGSREPVGRLRGRVHDCQGVPLVVSYDPVYLLRSPADKAGAWADLCLARDTLRARQVSA